MPSEFHCSIDIETLSLRPNAAILSIGATIFDIETGEEAESFEVNISQTDTESFNIDLNTLAWWDKQSGAAKYALHNPTPITLPSALNLLKTFLATRRLPLWCNKAFDTVILENAYRVYNLKPSWHYRDPKDLETLRFIGRQFCAHNGDPEMSALCNPLEVPHIALEDARLQAEQITAILKYILYVQENRPDPFGEEFLRA